MKKKTTKKLVLAKETLRELGPNSVRKVLGGDAIVSVAVCDPADDTRSKYWSCVCAESEQYTCEC